MNQTIKDYYANEALDQTKLKLLLGNDPRVFLNPPVIDTQATQFGSIVDCLLTDPMEFDNDYYVTEMETLPTDTIQNIINNYYSIIKEFPEKENTDVLLQCIKDAKYYPNWGDATKLTKVMEAGNDYLKELQVCGNRTMITKSNKELALTMISNLQRVFPEILMNTNPDIEVLYQVPLYFKYQDIDCKGLIDILVINHITKTVQIIDLKTFYDHPLEFNYAIKSHRYDIQLAFYRLGLIVLNKESYKDYDLLCSCLVSSKNYPEIPVLYMFTQNLLNMGLFGRKKAKINIEKQEFNFSQIEGINDLITKYKYYQEIGFEKDQRIVDNDSRLLMDWSGIV